MWGHWSGLRWIGRDLGVPHDGPSLSEAVGSTVHEIGVDQVQASQDPSKQTEGPEDDETMAHLAAK